MSRQVRLDDDVAALVDALNPEGLSLSGRTNELLRAFLAELQQPDRPRATPVVVEAARETRVARVRRRRGSDAPLSDREARALMQRLR